MIKNWNKRCCWTSWRQWMWTLWMFGKYWRWKGCCHRSGTSTHCISTVKHMFKFLSKSLIILDNNPRNKLYAVNVKPPTSNYQIVLHRYHVTKQLHHFTEFLLCSSFSAVKAGQHWCRDGQETELTSEMKLRCWVYQPRRDRHETRQDEMLLLLMTWPRH